MKHLLQFMALYTLLLFVKPSSAQTFFKDSTIWYGYNTGISSSQGDGAAYFGFMDSIHLDSMDGSGEHYSILRKYEVWKNGARWSAPNHCYKLRVNGKKVYYTGTYVINFSSNNDSINLLDQLIYDFSKTKGDTFTIFIGKFKYSYKVDSVVLTPFMDNKSRLKTYYHNSQIGSATEGLGNPMGLVYFHPKVLGQYLTEMPPSLISICSQQALVYKNPMGFYNTGYLCDADSIIEYLARATKAGLKSISTYSKIQIFPNPTDNLINIYPEFTGFLDFEIFNSLGILVKNGKISNKSFIDVHLFNEGTYFLRMKISDTQFSNAAFVVTH